MGEVNGHTPLYCQGKALKRQIVVGCDTSEKAVKMIAIRSAVHQHCAAYGCVGFAGALHGDAVVSYALNMGEGPALQSNPYIWVIYHRLQRFLSQERLMDVTLQGMRRQAKTFS